jgi:hypothetical protein
MARSNHAHYTAADRYERKASRRRQHVERRTATRRAVVAAALAEVGR